MLTRRAAMTALGGMAAVPALGGGRVEATGPDSSPLDSSRPDPSRLDPAAFARPGTPDDEVFWAEIGRAFTVDRSITNLNNGGVSPSPRLVQEAMRRHLEHCNATPPPIALWRELQPRVEPIRARMARHWGVDAEEIAFTRNTTESLHICQLGLDLAPGDEIVTSDQDYPRMRAAFRQRELREGLRYRQVSLPVPCEDDDEIVRRFEEAITPRTRVILMCHMVNLTGQILPVRAVAAMARRHGVRVIVDGAHALAHFPFRLDELECDFYGTSLHKWLFAPHGTGLLYVRREALPDVWPLMPSDRAPDDIRKFEEVGTHPLANKLAVAEALTFHLMLGDERKAARLRALRDRWARPILDASPRFRLHTSLDPRYSCGIATVELEGVGAVELAGWLLREHRILVTGIVHEQFSGIRVSPSVYSTPEEIDRFVEAMLHAERHGIGAG